MALIYHILNLGAGVQSSALYLMSHRGEEPDSVPLFDFAIFADTQEEPRAVYEHLEWLQSLNGPPILTRTAGKLGDDLIRSENLTGQRFASIPAFTSAEPGKLGGMLPRQCTGEYKVNVVEQAIRRDILDVPIYGRVPKDILVYQYMGLSHDEPRRVIKVKQRFAKLSWAKPRFPLFDLEMTRQDCMDYLATCQIPHTVPRSACVFCPYHNNAEWRQIRDGDPEGWARACEIDEAIRVEGNICNRGLDAKMYIHRSCQPLRDAPIDSSQSRGEEYVTGFTQECEGMCGV